MSEEFESRPVKAVKFVVLWPRVTEAGERLYLDRQGRWNANFDDAQFCRTKEGACAFAQEWAIAEFNVDEMVFR